MRAFISLQTADRPSSKPHPSMVLQAIADAGAAPETTIVVGDTSFDMGMAGPPRRPGIGAPGATMSRRAAAQARVPRREHR
jgi:phosphoglycolate phosphatase